MPSITLTFPTGYDPTAVAFTSVTREDTGATVSYTTNWVDGGDRIWVGTFVAPAAGLTYNYSATATIAGAASPFSGTYTDSSAGYVGRYTSSAKVKRKFKAVNVNAFSSSSGDEAVPDETAIQDAIVHAEDDIDSRFAGGPYTIPFAASGASLPAKLQEWATNKALYWLYEWRGFQDDKKGGAYQKLLDDTNDEIALFVGGLRHMPGVTYISTANAAITIVDPKAGPISAGANLLPTGATRYGANTFYAHHGHYAWWV